MHKSFSLRRDSDAFDGDALGASPTHAVTLDYIALKVYISPHNLHVVVPKLGWRLWRDQLFLFGEWHFPFLGPQVV